MQENYYNNYSNEGVEYSNSEMLNHAQPPQQSPQYDRIIQEEKVANFISQTSPYKTLSKIDYVLKGFAYDEGEKKWVKVSMGIPDKIRMDFLQAMTPHLTEDVRMGRLDMRTINNVMEFAIEWTVDYLDIVADDYYYDYTTKDYQEVKKIEEKEETRWGYSFDRGYIKMNNNGTRKEIVKSLSEEQMTKIAMVLWSALFYSLSRALNGVERDRMYNSLKMGDNFGEYAKQEEKKSILSSILPWK